MTDHSRYLHHSVTEFAPTPLRHHIWAIVLLSMHGRHASHCGAVTFCFRRGHSPSATLSTPYSSASHLPPASLCCLASFHSLPVSLHRTPRRSNSSSTHGSDASPSGDVTSIGACIRPLHTLPSPPPPSSCWWLRPPMPNGKWIITFPQLREEKED